jgi:hypothetical protein
MRRLGGCRTLRGRPRPNDGCVDQALRLAVLPYVVCSSLVLDASGRTQFGIGSRMFPALDGVAQLCPPGPQVVQLPERCSWDYLLASLEPVGLLISWVEDVAERARRSSVGASASDAAIRPPREIVRRGPGIWGLVGAYGEGFDSRRSVSRET